MKSMGALINPLEGAKIKAFGQIRNPETDSAFRPGKIAYPWRACPPTPYCCWREEGAGGAGPPGGDPPPPPPSLPPPEWGEGRRSWGRERRGFCSPRQLQQVEVLIPSVIFFLQTVGDDFGAKPHRTSPWHFRPFGPSTTMGAKWARQYGARFFRSHTIFEARFGTGPYKSDKPGSLNPPEHTLWPIKP
ncbi:hypothetical protein GWK47_040169 [Chionoecetes opilio]|uniref:Uncharacterized protein n=1 Tax=Chionoecetes opilio TaxID=41210 RepID=A0A8J4YIS7_CHIOP|nr:hypothetical protein GWK47_040169 [Chionoecetes opilio]